MSNGDRPPAEQIAEYVRLNPDTDAVGVLGALGLSPEWRDHVEDVLAGETPDTGAPEGDSRDGNPTPGADKGGSDPATTTPATYNGDEWADAEFSTTEPGTYPPTLADREQWMIRGSDLPPHDRPKAPYAPWADENGARWGEETNRADFATAHEWADADPRSSGLAFIQVESDPLAFVDGDDVRDPESGDVHPVFRALLEHLGATYADVSTSGAGVHAYYLAPDGLPIDGKGQATFEIDTEPWGANDAPPTVEVYANTHVNVTTGDHVAGTPTDAHEWDSDALRAILEAHGFGNDDAVTHDTDRDRPDLDGYDPVATDRDEATADVRDLLAAVDDLDPRDVPLRTRRTGEDATGWSTWDPSYRASESGESLHYNGDGVFFDHKKGEPGRNDGFGVLSLFAAEQGVISDPWDRLAGSDWFDALDAARDAGAPIPEYKPDDAEPAAALPLAKLDALSPAERDRFAQARGVNIPSTDDARRRLRDAVVRELRAGNTTVLDAPTALGKTHTVATEPWARRADVTGEAPVVHLHATTDARDEAAAKTRDSSADAAVLKGRKERCPVAAGDHDPVEDPDAQPPDEIVTIDGEPAREWFDRQCDEKGLPFSTAHALARERNDQDRDALPCCDGDGGDCPAVTQWDGLPRDDDGEPAVDVIHATHQFAYVPSLRRGTNIILDEQPDFTTELSQERDEPSQERIRRMINAYLRAIDAPVQTWEAFVSLARFDHGGNRSDAGRERDALDDALGRDPPTEWFVEDPDAHALAPDLAGAIWQALRWEDDDTNGRRSAKVLHEPPRLDAGEDDGYAGVWLSVVVDDENTVRTVRPTPDFSQARAVIGLDAHPSMPMWELNAAPGMVRDAVLDSQERRLWRRYERGLTVVQVGEATRPRSGSKAREWMNDDRVRAVLDALRDHYGDGFDTAITTTQVEPAVRRLLAETTNTELTDLDAEQVMHYGEEKSRNPQAFAGADAGYVYGCMDPGDGMILDALAELDLDAEPATAKTETGDVKREKGRTFNGDDADTARALLASVRENHVAQAAGRYARDPENPESNATVYVHTDAAPTGFVDLEAPGVEWLPTDLQREVIETLSVRPSATVREIAETVGCSKEHVRETLDRLEGEDLVVRRDATGKHGADVYQEAGADGALVDLGETTNGRLYSPNRWSLAITHPHREGCTPGSGTTTSPPPGQEATGADRPPNDAG